MSLCIFLQSKSRNHSRRQQDTNVVYELVKISGEELPS